MGSSLFVGSGGMLIGECKARNMYFYCSRREGAPVLLAGTRMTTVYWQHYYHFDSLPTMINWTWLLTNHFPFPLSTFLYCKCMCTCEDPTIDSLFVSTVANKIQSDVDHVSLAEIQIAACIIISAHIYVNRIH